MINPLLVPEEFNDWLRRHEPNAVVGERGSPCDCPLARFLNDRYGGVWDVDGYTVHQGTHRNEPMPPWAVDFAGMMDQMEASQSFQATPEIEREEALRALAYVLSYAH